MLTPLTACCWPSSVPSNTRKPSATDWAIDEPCVTSFSNWLYKIGERGVAGRFERLIQKRRQPLGVVRVLADAAQAGGEFAALLHSLEFVVHAQRAGRSTR